MTRSNLRPGDGYPDQRPERRGDILDLQDRLARAGYYVTIDGHYGPETRTAVKAFQKAHGLRDDDVVDQATSKKLIEVAGTEQVRTMGKSGAAVGPPPRDPRLIRNDGYPRTTPELSPAIREMQDLLNRQGVATVVDGQFGVLTEKAVVRFQGRDGLPATGVVDPPTWAALRRPPKGRPIG